MMRATRTHVLYIIQQLHGRLTHKRYNPAITSLSGFCKWSLQSWCVQLKVREHRAIAVTAWKLVNSSGNVYNLPFLNCQALPTIAAHYNHATKQTSTGPCAWSEWMSLYTRMYSTNLVPADKGASSISFSYVEKEQQHADVAQTLKKTCILCYIESKSSGR